MVVIDPSKGGSNSGVIGNGITEKDFNLMISEYIYDRLNELGIDTKLIRTSDEYLGNDQRVSRIINAFGNNSKVVALSNTLGRGSDGVQIIYALRNKDTLAKSISDNLENNNINVDKYYQRRSEDDTSKDYYDIQKDTGVIETIIVNYGNVDNESEASNLKNNYKKYAESVIKAIANYQGVPYYLEGQNDNLYIVKKGDSLYSIAGKFNTTVDKIKKLNNLKSNNLSIGQKLTIPVIETGNSEETYIVQKGDNLYSIASKFNTTVDNLKKINNLTSNNLSIGQILKISLDTNDEIYTVKKGDSLYQISLKYGVSVDDLKKFNNLINNNLSIGQTIKIPKVISTDTNVYTVKKGDSLYLIASKFGINVNDLKSYNNLTSNLLSIGQKLKIPSPTPINSNNLYTVKKGDSLYSIAGKFNTTVDNLKNINNLTSNLLSIGEQLKIK